MTSKHESGPDGADGGPLSLLPEPSMNIRVRPAEFARLIGVSRQSVSRWVQDGKVTLGPDGRLDPKVAAKQVLNNTDPARLRANVLKPLVNDVGELRRQIKGQATRLETLEAELEQACAGERLFMALVDEFDGLLREREAELRDTEDSAAWLALLDELYEEAEALAEATTQGSNTDEPTHGPELPADPPGAPAGH